MNLGREVVMVNRGIMSTMLRIFKSTRIPNHKPSKVKGHFQKVKSTVTAARLAPVEAPPVTELAILYKNPLNIMKTMKMGIKITNSILTVLSDKRASG
jgi:hypothetical protein